MRRLMLLSIVAAAAFAQGPIKLKVDGMMCPACAKTVKESALSVKGVKGCSVYLKEGRAEVEADKSVKPEQVCDAIKKVGYGCKVQK
ncbi:MAG: heavy-metal-associated domain-containing protein [Campylobacterales bacterium]